MRLRGKVAVITGSTRGIGEGIALRFAREGAKVVVSGRTAADGERVARLIQSQGGGDSTFIRADVGDEGAARALIDGTVEHFGALHVLVNNAAMTGIDPETADRPLVELPTEVFRKIFEVDFMSVVFCTKAAIPRIQASGGGSIINISSTTSMLAISGMPAYTAAKGAMNALTRQLAVEYGPDVRVNAIIVGSVDAGTEFSQRKRANPVIRAAHERLHVTRLGERDDVAAAAAFLASDEDAGFITGSHLILDGGVLAKMQVPNIAKLVVDEATGAGERRS
jgi:NAD(P)-dependent dehydrogenase (short-subunit alcohol dehydrogenase family)